METEAPGAEEEPSVLSCEGCLPCTGPAQRLADGVAGPGAGWQRSHLQEERSCTAAGRAAQPGQREAMEGTRGY